MVMSETSMTYMISATEKILNTFLPMEFPDIEEIKVTPHSDDRVMVMMKIKRGEIAGRYRELESRIKSLVPMVGGRAGELTVPDSNKHHWFVTSIVYFSKPFVKS